MNIELLRRLCEMPGVPGREHRVRALIESEIEGLFDETYTDPMGSLICTRYPTKPRQDGEAPRVLLLCHMDEIGFLVSHVTKDGYIHIDPVGGFDPRNLFSRRVLVCTKEGDFKGVMNPAGKPIHTQSPEERKKIPEPTDFFVDIGLGEETKNKVQIGDYIVMDEPLLEMGDKIVSKALDNRIACWLGIEALRQLVQSGDVHECEIIVAFTAQEEVGLRGARTASFGVAPDIAFGIDTTLACDTPGIPEKDAVTHQGKGFGLHVKDGSFIADIDLVEELEALAKERDIPSQRTILARGGQDGAAGQQAGSGARAAGIVVGTRYIHTVTEMIEKGDLEAARNIIAAYLGSH
ncbi:MAG: M20/M25/M40 family metallo-hydrolase [Cohaesibacter sp.]|nr:M20/M25/M40 family metallo-hydrolase [Cohaesibacter sp.]MCV6601912.1 M20/M25/M40 family metallo-hydrolase [Cohaesibacter sp.]